MIEKSNLKIDALYYYLNHQISVYAGIIIGRQKEDSDIVNYKVSDNSDWFVFDFVDKDVVIGSLNEELRDWDTDIAVTDYEIDREAGYIQFKIE